jgi:hypothetical protein
MIRRREIIMLLGGAAGWPLTLRVRADRIGPHERRHAGVVRDFRGTRPRPAHNRRAVPFAGNQFDGLAPFFRLTSRIDS